jgi:hypothetical protein
VATLRILLFGPKGGANTLRDLLFVNDEATARINPLRIAIAADVTARLSLGSNGNCTATAVAPHSQLFAGETEMRSGISMVIRVSWFGNWSESTMGTWAQLVGGTSSASVGNSRTFDAQTAYTSGDSAPVTSSWLTETISAVQSFQMEANVPVSASLDVGGVVVTTPRSSTIVDQCGSGGSAVLCTALVPSVIVGSFCVVMLICAVVLHRERLSGGMTRFADNLLDRGRPRVEQGSSKWDEGEPFAVTSTPSATTHEHYPSEHYEYKY